MIAGQAIYLDWPKVCLKDGVQIKLLPSDFGEIGGEDAQEIARRAREHYLGLGWFFCPARQDLEMASSFTFSTTNGSGLMNLGSFR